MHERIRDRILGNWGRWVASHPLVTLSISLPLAIACVWLAAARLEFRPDRSDLIDPGRSWNQRYHQYKEVFPRANEDVIVALEATPEAPADELARAIAQRLVADSRVASADAGFDASECSPRLFLMAPRDRFDATLREIAAARSLAGAPDAAAGLDLLLRGLSESRTDAGPDALRRLDDILAPYLDAATGAAPDFSPLSPRRPRWQPLASDGVESLRYVRVHFKDGRGGGVNTFGANLAWLRRTVGGIVGHSSAPQTRWGVTGIPAIESDETTQAIRDSRMASILALLLITLVMAVAFRGLRVPLLAAAALLVGMAYSFGWLIVTVGHLQLLSVVFSVILLGLGIDFALLYVTRLELVADEHRNLASATSRVYRRVGPGMVTGAVTTASAFLAIALTDFKGMAEMGVIAAGGILLCMIAVLSVFPALLALTGQWKRIIRHRPGGETAHFAHGRLDAVDAHPVATLLVAGLAVAALAAGAMRVRYDPNVLNLQSEGVESVQWEKRLVEQDARSAWAAVVLARPEQAASLAARLRAVPDVSAVDAMGRVVPPDLKERMDAVAALRAETLDLPAASPGIPAVLERLREVRRGLEAWSRLPGSPTQASRAMADRIGMALESAEAMSAAARDETWRRLQAAFAPAQKELAAWVEEALLPLPPGPQDLPALLRDLWVGTDGSWLLQVQPQTDPIGRSILDPRRLEPFVTAIRDALVGTGAAVIGPPVQIYESSELIKGEYRKAAALAVAAILLLLFLDFRNLADTLCAIMPVFVGFLGAFGLMGLFGVPLNFANIIVLPIIFGIGVNAGVHVVHRWRLEPFGRPRGLSGSTGRAITLTMLTTIIGFGCLMIAEHRGIRSLGFVMVIGLGVTLLACYTALPALLRLRTRTESITAEGRLARRVARVATAARPRRRPAGARH
jgi:hypothetical protein